MLELRNVCKTYKTKESVDVNALSNVNLLFGDNGIVFLLGPSGSGKTTALNIIGGIDDLSDGEVFYNGVSLKSISDSEYRRNVVSFVFQDFNLLPNLNVLENISLITSSKENDKKQEPSIILNSVGLKGYEKRRTQELSGGQKQRVAIGRALAKDCKILLCDEPTGNLDSKTSEGIFEVLKIVSRNKLVIVVSHNKEMAEKYGDRIVSLEDGIIKSDEIKCDFNSETSDDLVNNSVSFVSKIKYGFLSLTACKFKTIISTVLLILSILSMCLMVMFTTYDSAYINAKSTKDDKCAYLICDTGDNGLHSNYCYGGSIDYVCSLNVIDSILGKVQHLYGYSIQNTLFYIVDEENESLLSDFDFYFKEPLDETSCYITDYYLLFVMLKNKSYSIPSFDNIEELKDKPVYYKNVFQYNIKGIIKSGYSEYYDERGNQKTSDVNLDYAYYDKEHKLSLIYNAIYGKEEVFSSISYGFNHLVYNSDSSQITVKEGTYFGKLPFLDISFIDNTDNLTFFMNNGYYGSIKEETYHAKKVSLNNDEIVISPDLYDYIFGTNINWDILEQNVYEGINNETYVTNILPHLGDTISFSIASNDIMLEINDVIIKGVTLEYGVDDDDYKYYTIYGLEHMFGLSNYDLADCVVCFVDYQNVENKYELLSNAVDNGIVISGMKAHSAYENEFFCSVFSIFFKYLTAVLIAISCMAVINLVIHRINDNKKEIGILYSSGCNKKDICIMYMTPIIFITLLSIFISLALLVMGSKIGNIALMHSEVGYIEFISINLQTILSLLATVFLIILLSLIPLGVYLRKKPINIIR